MAKYISPGREYIPTTREIRGTLSGIGDNKIGEIEKFFNKLGGNISVVALSSNRWSIEFRIHKELSTREMKKLNSFGQGSIDVHQNYETYEHQGYIKRDVTETHNIDENTKVRLWDIPKDKDGNEWEVSLLKNEPYYCCDCNDMHNSWSEIEKHLFKSRRQADNKYTELTGEPVGALDYK